MVVEMRLLAQDGTLITYLAQSLFVSKSIQDSVLMVIEHAFSNDNIRPHELHDAIPTVKPVYEGFSLSECTEGHYFVVPPDYKYDITQRDHLSALPFVDWLLLYKLCERRASR